MPERIDISKIKTHPLVERKSKVGVEDFSRPADPALGMKGLFDSLPNILAAKDLRSIIAAVVHAYREKRGIIWAMGAHVIKCGLSPIIIDLIEQGIVTAIAFNGAGLIHDFEIAFSGSTSEDVEAGLKEGEFGMAAETGQFLNRAINEGVKEGLGIGEAVGRWMNAQHLEYLKYSIVAKAVGKNVPVTVHVAIGTDIIHMHPDANGASLGEGSLRDFHTLVASIRTLDDGGVYFNIGSAVILPEVFLKALTLAINLGSPLHGFTTVNIDFIQHYRPIHNVVKRPVAGRGTGYALTGHHEILVPLIAAWVKNEIGCLDI